MSKLLKYAPDCTRISAEHGFWNYKELRSKGEMVALMVSELSEAVEGHRKDRLYSKQLPYEPLVQILNDHHPTQSPEPFCTAWLKTFQTAVKDTVEDEIADTVIRVLDYIYGWELSFFESEYRKGTTGNFAHDILRIQYYIIMAFHNDDPEREVKFPQFTWGYVLAAIEKFCEWYHIDIEQHVQWKLRYNETRPYKHGKSY